MNKTLQLFFILWCSAPQIGINILGSNLRLFFAFVFVLFLVIIKKLSHKWSIQKSFFRFTLFFLFIIFTINILQYLFVLGVYEGHLANADYGVQSISSFGFITTSDVVFFNPAFVRAISYLIVISLFLIALLPCKREIYIICKYIIYGIALFQLFHLVLYFANLEILYSKYFVSTAIREDGIIHTGITARSGLMRFSGGYSEPSIMAGTVWMLVSIVFINFKFNEYVTFCKSVFFPALVILLTTVSFFSLLITVIIAVSIFSRSKRIIVLILMLVLFFTQFIEYIIPKEFFTGPLASFTVRQLLSTNVFELDFIALMLGVSFGNLYNFLVFDNVLVELGLFGFSLLLILNWKMISIAWAFSLLVYLSVVPNMTFFGFYLFLLFNSYIRFKHEF